MFCGLASQQMCKNSSGNKQSLWEVVYLITSTSNKNKIRNIIKDLIKGGLQQSIIGKPWCTWTLIWTRRVLSKILMLICAIMKSVVTLTTVDVITNMQMRQVARTAEWMLILLRWMEPLHPFGSFTKSHVTARHFNHFISLLTIIIGLMASEMSANLQGNIISRKLSCNMICHVISTFTSLAKERENYNFVTEVVILIFHTDSTQLVVKSKKTNLSLEKLASDGALKDLRTRFGTFAMRLSCKRTQSAETKD